jgi:hypothetical protein
VDFYLLTILQTNVMEQFKRAKVIMLPTSEKPKLGNLLLRHLWKDDPKLECKSLWQYKETITIENVVQYTVLNSTFRDSVSLFKPQHLYIISDDEIKDEDWISDGKIVLQSYSNIQEIVGSQLYLFKKIIATTDPSLNLPKPTDNFLQIYAEYYNKNKTITDVLVESFSNFEGIYKGKDAFPEDNISWWVEKVRVKEDNTVEIRVIDENNIKELFKEVKVLLLPTENKENSLWIDERDYALTNHFLIRQNAKGAFNHLYIVSNEEPKLDEWGINITNNALFKGSGFASDDYSKKNFKKIIATTNRSLKIEDDSNSDADDARWARMPLTLPKLANKFISYFVYNYNKGKIITNALVEYETYQDSINYHKDIFHNFERVKVDPKSREINIMEIPAKKMPDSQFRKAKVSMLPSKVTSRILKSGITNKLDGLPFLKENKKDTYQELYFTTDEPIKDGDWFLNNDGVWKCKDGVIPSVLNPRKIIATTDSDLGNGDNVGLWSSLPQPSIQFVQKYIESYNKDQIITDVLIEYGPMFPSYQTWVDDINTPPFYGNLKLKVNPKDNTITIKKLKDVWFKEEIELSIMYCLSEFAAERGLTPTAEQMKLVNDWGKKWCEENL